VNREKILLGIDPGLAKTGFGIVGEQGNRLKCYSYGIIKTHSNEEMSKRLLALYQKMQELVQKYSPREMVLEKIFFSRNVKTAFQVGQARGVVILTAAQNDIPVFEYTPLEIKKAITGYGQAEKKQVQTLVKSILNLKEKPHPDDASDALGAAICHIQTQNWRKKVEEYL